MEPIRPPMNQEKLPSIISVRGQRCTAEGFEFVIVDRNEKNFWHFNGQNPIKFIAKHYLGGKMENICGKIRVGPLRSELNKTECGNKFLLLLDFPLPEAFSKYQKCARY